MDGESPCNRKHKELYGDLLSSPMHDLTFSSSTGIRYIVILTFTIGNVK